ncbi:NF-kappa-B inhibitor zeta isoform X2 [Engraulis encrasicolus]|uniref:NF-kappa-B inhibitor zeta isoform X2 n=1 Tax=Engraulis encrasicolus TaxID=184585 RepID=UPI002FD1BFE8
MRPRTDIQTNGDGDVPTPPSSGKRSRGKTEKSYLGVRVRMPVKDMLRNIRIAKGMDPKDIQRIYGKASKGDKKRVKTSAERRNNQKKHTMAQEELSIIVEVLEEDLKASSPAEQPSPCPTSPTSPLSPGCPPSPCSPEPSLPLKDFFPQTYMCNLSSSSGGSLGSPEMPMTPEPFSPCSVPSPGSSPSPSPEANTVFSFPGAEYRQSIALISDSFGGYGSDGFEDMRRSPPQYTSSMSDPPSPTEYPPIHSSSSYHGSYLPSPEPAHYGLGREHGGEGVLGLGRGSPPLQGQCWQRGGGGGGEWREGFYFWNQLEREENQLRWISNRELMATDENGKVLLHRLVEEGRQAPVYIVAKRMAAMMQLDAKDSEGKTALHLAAQRNQHLMVADLISLGANVNERDRYGKTCLHLSAENGYVRVLEVIKNSMKDGVHVNLEVKDLNGLSVLQSAAVALSCTVREEEQRGLQSHGHSLQSHGHGLGPSCIQTLRKQQMMETLECLLQMESNMHNVHHGLGLHTSAQSLMCEHAGASPPPSYSVAICKT